MSRRWLLQGSLRSKKGASRGPYGIAGTGICAPRSAPFEAGPLIRQRRPYLPTSSVLASSLAPRTLSVVFTTTAVQPPLNRLCRRKSGADRKCRTVVSMRPVCGNVRSVFTHGTRHIRKTNRVAPHRAPPLAQELAHRPTPHRRPQPWRVPVHARWSESQTAALLHSRWTGSPAPSTGSPSRPSLPVLQWRRAVTGLPVFQWKRGAPILLPYSPQRLCLPCGNAGNAVRIAFPQADCVQTAGKKRCSAEVYRRTPGRNPREAPPESVPHFAWVSYLTCQSPKNRFRAAKEMMHWTNCGNGTRKPRMTAILSSRPITHAVSAHGQTKSARIHNGATPRPSCASSNGQPTKVVSSGSPDGSGAATCRVCTSPKTVMSMPSTRYRGAAALPGATFRRVPLFRPRKASSCGCWDGFAGARTAPRHQAWPQTPAPTPNPWASTATAPPSRQENPCSPFPRLKRRKCSDRKSYSLRLRVPRALSPGALCATSAGMVTGAVKGTLGPAIPPGSSVARLVAMTESLPRTTCGPVSSRGAGVTMCAATASTATALVTSVAARLAKRSCWPTASHARLVGLTQRGSTSLSCIDKGQKATSCQGLCALKYDAPTRKTWSSSSSNLTRPTTRRKSPSGRVYLSFRGHGTYRRSVIKKTKKIPSNSSSSLGHTRGETIVATSRLSSPAPRQHQHVHPASSLEQTQPASTVQDALEPPKRWRDPTHPALPGSCPAIRQTSPSGRVRRANRSPARVGCASSSGRVQPTQADGPSHRASSSGRA